jgi:hypothetical protein
VKVFAVRGRVAQVRSCPFLSLALDGAHLGEDTTIVRNRNVNRRGVPQASVLRLGVCILNHGKRSRQRMKTGNDEFKSRARKPDVRSTRFIPALGVRATRRRRPFPGSPGSLGDGKKTQITAPTATL